MKINTRSALMDRTHEGAPIPRITPEKELRRYALTALLWENTFYEKGSDAADRCAALIPQLNPDKVADLAIEAREAMHLRHLPLFLVRELARAKGNGALVAKTLERIIQRADELAEFLAIYWKDKKQPLSAGVKRGLAAAFRKFDAYALGKYNRDGAIKLRDVLFLTHAKPLNEDQAELWKRLVDGTLESPDTWEVALSAGADKKATWERLLREKQLGGLAVLRNLRNMISVNVDEALIRERLGAGIAKALPWRFIAAAKHAPRLEDAIEGAMLQAVQSTTKLPGRTALLIDVSGSMNVPMSEKSEMTRMDAAAGLAILLREQCDTVYVGTFSNEFVEVPARRGFALRDAVVNSQDHQGTYLNKAMQAQRRAIGSEVDRLIILTDGESHDGIGPRYAVNCYMLNIAPYKNGVGYGDGWQLINGFSERVVDYIAAIEEEAADSHER